MTGHYVLAIDQGTTSTRCILFDYRGRLVSVAQREHQQHYPHPGWVEHDAMEIWRNVRRLVPQALAQAGVGAGQVAAIGIANQRETTVLWDRVTGAPIGRAVNWQDTRTDALIEELAARTAAADRFSDRCGLPLATYFAGPRIRWMLDATPGAAGAGGARRGALRHHGDLADLEPHRRPGGRRPRHRRDQREPDDADGHLHPGVVRRAAGRHRGAAGDAAGDPLLRGGVRQGVGGAARGVHRGRAGRPAGGPVRPDLLLPRRGQVHVRDRLVPAAEHRRGDRPVVARAAHHGRLQDRRRRARVRAGGRDRDHRLAGAVVPGQPRADQQRGRDRDARADRGGQRRLLHRAGLLRAVRPALAVARRAASSSG